MKVGGGLNNEGLAFGYDANSWSFGGEPTTNLAASITIAGMQGISLSYIGIEDGWKKYSMSGTFSSGTYPYCMYLQGVSFTGGVKYSTQAKIRTNVEDKFNYFGTSGVNYVNQPKDHNGTASSTQPLINGQNYPETRIVRREGFAYTSTTTQSGYLHTNPINGTTFNSSTDFVYLKDFQIEQKDHCTPYVNGTRSNTEGLIDMKGNQTLDTTNVSWVAITDSYGGRHQYPNFNGTSDHIDIDSVTLGNGNWTIETIVNTHASNYHILSNSSGGPVTNAFGVQNNKMFYKNYDGAWQDNSGAITVNYDEYYHLVWVNREGASASTGTMDLYVNGVKDSNSGFNSYTTNGGPVNIIGGNWTSGYFNGVIPVMRRYTVALSDEQVEQHYKTYKTTFGLS